MKPKRNKIPAVLKPFIWSYDPAKMDLEHHKKRIITNVLNLGTKEATDQLFQLYSHNDIKEAVADPLPGEWNDRSLNYWSIIFGIEPKSVKNVIRNIR